MLLPKINRNGRYNDDTVGLHGSHQGFFQKVFPNPPTLELDKEVISVSKRAQRVRSRRFGFSTERGFRTR